MLMGEHAVLRGKGAIVAAVNQRLNIKMTVNDTRTIEIKSELGHYSKPLSELTIEKPFSFILASILKFQPDCGLSLDIKSDFDAQLGLGSSAAVAACMVALLRDLKAEAFDQRAIFDDALSIIRSVQGGKGSGADLAASVYGGLLYYKIKSDKIEITPLKHIPAIHCFYSGAKEKTTDVIDFVSRNEAKNPTRYLELFNEMDELVMQAKAAINQANWDEFASLITLNQALMTEMKLVNEPIRKILNALSTEPKVSAAKISGSGLGDCVFALGELSENFCYDALDLHLSERGLELNQ